MRIITEKRMKAGIKRLEGTRSDIMCSEINQMAQVKPLSKAITLAFYAGVEVGARIIEKRICKGVKRS